MIKMPPVKYEMINLGGGMDQITPTISLPPGVCRDAVNFECLEYGGYGRIGGYERYDGHASPSDAVYALLYVASFTNTPTSGQTITNGTATGVVIATGSNYVAITKQSGTFSVGDSLTVGATPIGTVATPSAVSSAVSAQLTNLAASAYRSDISAPTGSGPIRGVFLFDDLVYCLRDNAGATAMGLFVESATGWQPVTLFNEVTFTSGGASAPADGSTLTQGGVTATVKRAARKSGAWASNTAAGVLIVSNPSGGNFSAGAATIGGISVTLGGAQTAITLSPGGRCEFVQANFFGQASGTRIYCADGVNRMWEFDGTVLVPLTTGLATDAPNHVASFKKYLWYSYGSSAFSSALGDPYDYTALNGAVELACGDAVTGLLVQPGDAASGSMTIFCRNSTNMLYGTSSLDWNLVSYNIGTGSLPYTQQNLANTFMMDDRGVFALAATLQYGNFQQTSLTNAIRPFIAEHRRYVASSTLARDKSQYRLFFSDNWGLYITLVNGKFMGAMPVYFGTSVTCAWECTKSDGELVKFFGGEDGMVYQMDVGTSFDGSAINAYITLNWDSVKSPRILKRWRRASLEVSGSSYASLTFGYSLGYASDQLLQPNSANYAAPFQATYWDSFTWDNFVWDGRTLMPSECEVVGTSENIQLSISTNSTDFAPFAINSVILHHTPRRGLR